MVRTRFAPSPTGYLHIGGVRTALFNWLFARHHGGEFILRIDDTDAQRNVDEALAPILHGFRYLGIDWDEGPEVGGPHGPYFQSQRLEKYQSAAEELLSADWAYHDYARPEEIQSERGAAEKQKRSFRYSRTWMAESDKDRARFEAEGRTSVVRLKMPLEGSVVIDDLVRGPVEFQWAREQDHVIQRGDGTCLYHLASVVDDHDFEITHVIRAEEHLSNTPRQIFIAQGLGFDPPTFAHLPFVAEPGSKNKLSKRKLEKYLKNRDFARLNQHGQSIAQGIGLQVSAETFNPVIVDFYQQIGFLPEAILNYLALLGWSLDDKTEDFTPAALIESFSLERVNKAAASFDPQKLEAFQSRYMQQLSTEQKLEMMLPFLQKAGHVADSPPPEIGQRLTDIIKAAGDRLSVAGDILQYDDFFIADDALAYDEKRFEKRLRKPPEAKELLAKFRERLGSVDPFDQPSLEIALKAFVEGEEIQIGQIIHALRIAVTGKAVGFGMFDILAILGREACLRRIDLTLGRI